jgi:hypothetical protein
MYLISSCYSRIEMAYIKTKIQNFHIDSRPELYVLSNGVLVFGVSHIIMYRKMDKTIHGNCASIQPQFSA